MMRAVRRAGILLLLLFSATPVAGQRSSRRVIDRRAIAAAGWHRLGDVVAALPPGSTASIDGFNHELRGSRLGFAATTQVQATWLVRLDGQVMPMQVGGLWILDLVPVAMTQVDSVVIDDQPRLSEGRAVVLGTIDLYTRRPARPASLVADYQHGDETGDPGPYRYTARSTPNIEKIGPFTSGAAAVAIGRVSVDGGARYSSLNITDPRIASRLGAAFPTYQSDVNASGGSGAITIDALGGRTYIIGGRGRFTGYMPLPTVAGDQQGRVVASEGGMSGTAKIIGREWSYAANATQLEVQPMATPLLVDPQTRRVVDGFLETAIGRTFSIGAGATTGRSETPSLTRERSSQRGWLTYSDHDNRTASAALERVNGEIELSGSGRVAWSVGDSESFAIAASALNAARASDFTWMDQAIPDSADVHVLDLRAELATRTFLGTRPSWYARAFRYSGEAAATSGIGAGVVATTQPSTDLRATMRAEVTQMLGGGNPGETSTPGGFIEASMMTRTVGGFDLALAGRYAPEARWTGEADEVPATRRIDFSVNKSMWRDRIRAQLVTRNLLNAAERTHPEGAQWNLRTHLAVTVALPTGASAR
jgi:hypothetical protein